MRRIRTVITPCFVAFLSSIPKTWAAEELIVSAAASMTNVMTAVQHDFQKSHSSIRLIFNFGSSGSLVQQIRHGAPADIFISANPDFMHQLAEKDLIVQSSRTDFTSNQMVVIVPVHSRYSITGLENLLSSSFPRIAIGHPGTVPAGRYAKAALMETGLWDQLQDKLIFGNSVRQVLAYTIREEVAAGIVYASDIIAANGKVRTVLRLKNTDPILYPVAMIAMSNHKVAGMIFIRFLVSETGQRILDQYGFIRIQGGKP